jgi:hypothetical protein
MRAELRRDSGKTHRLPADGAVASRHFLIHAPTCGGGNEVTLIQIKSSRLVAGGTLRARATARRNFDSALAEAQRGQGLYVSSSPAGGVGSPAGALGYESPGNGAAPGAAPV